MAARAAIESCLDKVRQVKEMADKLGQTVLIEVDGGIKLDNLERVQDAGYRCYGFGCL